MDWPRHLVTRIRAPATQAALLWCPSPPLPLLTAVHIASAMSSTGGRLGSRLVPTATGAAASLTRPAEPDAHEFGALNALLLVTSAAAASVAAACIAIAVTATSAPQCSDDCIGRAAAGDRVGMLPYRGILPAEVQGVRHPRVFGCNAGAPVTCSIAAIPPRALALLTAAAGGRGGGRSRTSVLQAGGHVPEIQGAMDPCVHGSAAAMYSADRYPRSRSCSSFCCSRPSSSRPDTR